MKRIISLLLALVMLYGCAAGGTTVSSTPEVAVFRDVEASGSGMTQQANLTYEQVIDLASDVFAAKFVEYGEPDDEGRYELKFTLGDVFKGSGADGEVYLLVTPSNRVGDKCREYNYVEGHDYLLVTEKHYERYADHDRFYPLGSIFIPLTDPITPHMNYQPLALAGMSDIAAYTKELCADSPAPAPVTIPYTRTTDVADVVRASEFVLLVTVGDEIPGMPGIYNCAVEQVVKGDYEVPDVVCIPFLEDVTPQHSYYVAVNRADGADSVSAWFAESTPRSLFDVDDAASVAELLSYIGD